MPAQPLSQQLESAINTSWLINTRLIECGAPQHICRVLECPGMQGKGKTAGPFEESVHDVHQASSISSHVESLTFKGRISHVPTFAPLPLQVTNFFCRLLVSMCMAT